MTTQTLNISSSSSNGPEQSPNQSISVEALIVPVEDPERGNLPATLIKIPLVELLEDTYWHFPSWQTQGGINIPQLDYHYWLKTNSDNKQVHQYQLDIFGDPNSKNVTQTRESKHAHQHEYRPVLDRIGIPHLISYKVILENGWPVQLNILVERMLATQTDVPFPSATFKMHRAHKHFMIMSKYSEEACGQPIQLSSNPDDELLTLNFEYPAPTDPGVWDDAFDRAQRSYGIDPNRPVIGRPVKGQSFFPYPNETTHPRDLGLISYRGTTFGVSFESPNYSEEPTVMVKDLTAIRQQIEREILNLENLEVSKNILPQEAILSIITALLPIYQNDVTRDQLEELIKAEMCYLRETLIFSTASPNNEIGSPQLWTAKAIPPRSDRIKKLPSGEVIVAEQNNDESRVLIKISDNNILDVTKLLRLKRLSQETCQKLLVAANKRYGDNFTEPQIDEIVEEIMSIKKRKEAPRNP